MTSPSPRRAGRRSKCTKARSRGKLDGRPTRLARVGAADRRCTVAMPISYRSCRSRMTAARPEGRGIRFDPGAVFAPDGDRILTASDDKTARLSKK
jgi:hypothetical protein